MRLPDIAVQAYKYVGIVQALGAGVNFGAAVAGSLRTVETKLNFHKALTNFVALFGLPAMHIRVSGEAKRLRTGKDLAAGDTSVRCKGGGQ